MMGNLGRRVVTALILAGLFLAALFLLPPLLFTLLIGLVVLLGGWEWAQLPQPTGRLAGPLLGLALLVLGGLVWLGDQRPLLAQLGALFWLLAAVAVLSFPRGTRFWRQPLVHGVAGIAVLLPAWAALSWLQAQPAGAWFIVWTLLIVVATDVGGYFAGRALGRHKLAPRVSPGKTLEGLAGGLLLAGLVSLAVFLAGGRELVEPVWAVLLTLLLVAAAVFGDLFESLVKRVAGVKDSGTLLPGHGGLLDRFDAATAALPVAAALVIWFGAGV